MLIFMEVLTGVAMFAYGQTWTGKTFTMEAGIWASYRFGVFFLEL